MYQTFEIDPESSYLADWGITFPKLTANQEKELARKIQQGDLEAKEQFILANIPLVRKIARKFINKGLEYADLIQEGNIGLIKAVHKFNPDKGLKFSTMATNWIRQSISRAINDKANTIRMPVHLGNYWTKMQKFQFESSDIKTLSQKTGLTCSQIQDVRKAIHIQPISIFEPIGEDVMLLDSLEDSTFPSPEDYALNKVLRQNIFEALKTLSQIEYKVITLYFGLEDGVCYNHPEIAEKLNTTEHVVFKAKHNACQKLRGLLANLK